MTATAMLAAILVAHPALAANARRLSSSEKMASALLESRRCEVNPDNGSTVCRYKYRGLQFSRRVIMPTGLVFVDVERIDPGSVSVMLNGYGPCFHISLAADTPERAGIVAFNVKDGKMYLGDAPESGCYLKPGQPAP